jgi:uncharacterized membrane protein
MKKIRSTFFVITGLVLVALGFPLPASAQGAWSGDCVYEGVATIQGIGCVIGNLLNVAITMIGLASLAMFIYAGFRYMLSNGESKGIEAAKKAMTSAVLAMVVALSAYIIIYLIYQFTGVESLLKFTIPSSDS